MPTQIAIIKNSQNSRAKSFQALGMIAAMLFLASALPIRAQDNNNSGAEGGQHSGIGFSASKDASAKDVGLPWYPGARRSKETSNDSSSVQLGFWSGSSAFKLAVLKLESDDVPAKVQTYYRKALSKYGHVLTCPGSSNTTNESKSDGNKNSDQLDCETDNPGKDEIVLKVGTKDNQHIVSIKPNGAGSTFNLVYVHTPADSKLDVNP
jgi:hypothetical protein